MTAKPLERILYVEDEPDIQAVGKIALEAVGGFTLEVCSDGNEALRKAPGFAPQLILLDVMMPGLDGPATFEGLRKLPETANVPIVFLTAKTQASEVAKLRDLGALEVLTKPFDPMTLSDQVRSIWESQDEDTEHDGD